MTRCETVLCRFMLLVVASIVLSNVAYSQTPVLTRFESGAGPLDNPLKGWCQYPGVRYDWQPASMVFHYASWKELEPAEGRYAFDQWEENHWNDQRHSDRHVVFRVYVDYPTKESGLPDWLRAKGVTQKRYEDHGGGKSPDYDHPEMVAAMVRFIRAMGERYNKDPRVAFVQLGMLGHWGEWHTFPRDDLFASEPTQKRVIDAFHESFPDKMLMARRADTYAGEQSWIGFHDDYFPDDTDNGEEWSFMAKIRASGRDSNWRVAGIGGEMIPGAAKKYMGSDFDLTLRMVERSHFSWVGPYCPLHEQDPPKPFIDNCERMLRRMGYQFSLVAMKCFERVSADKPITLLLAGSNQGVAPFYYPWQAQFALLDEANRVAHTMDTDWDIRQWQPGKTFREKTELSIEGVQPDDYRLAIGIIDPWKQKPAIRFANQLNEHQGWTILGPLTVDP